MNDVPAVAPEVATVSAAATPISYVCANKESGLLFYLATCKKSQTKVSVAPDVEKQFKACYWALCNGQLMTINQNQALFSLLGTDVSAASRITSRGNRP